MDKALLQVKLDDLADWMVGQGVQREDAESIIKYARNRAIVSEAEAADDAQFLLDLKRTTTAGMMARTGLSRQAIHKRKTNINRRLTARLTG